MDVALLLVYTPVVLLVTAGTQALTGKAMAQLSVLQWILESNPLYCTSYCSSISYGRQTCGCLGHPLSY